MIARRELLLLAALAAAGPALAAPRAVVTILGDSITAGFGLPAAQAFPARLQEDLTRAGAQVLIRAAGVSGDTTAGGLARVDFSVQPDTTICLVALGGNDLLQGVDPKVTQANLEAIITRLTRRHIRVILAGLKPPPAIGRSYAQEFTALYANLARTHHLTLYPDLLAGVGPGLRQRDGLHPNAQGAQVIATGLAPVITTALKGSNSKSWSIS
ncbi:arylesterase [Phenylobacterium aquaticum]|uniref:arylesterase n=1 Tax=Phenylobacterium aquaticum TaxID=1763816 RepID=UPI0026EAF704|nr:arylesterase [Phenylobacterium aquaticum]